jgi:N-acetylmuramoyl-L-alanine amidase
MLALLLALSVASGDSLQASRLDEAKARIEQLRSDARRRRYRDGWESILRELDAAARAAPKGARAAEVALTAAKVRCDLFEASRTQADARAAFAALRKVDEEHPGPVGLQALYQAVLLSWRTKSAGDRTAAAKHLVERYPESAEAKAVAARTAELEGGPRPEARPSAVAEHSDAAAEARARAMDAALARATESAAAAPPAATGQVVVPRLPSAPVQTVAPVIPGTPRPPVAVTPVVLSAPRPQPAAPAAAPVVASAPRAQPLAARPAAPVVAPAADADDDDEDDDAASPPEPEAVEAPPSKTGPIMRAVKDAVAAITSSDDEPLTAEKAREIRSTALSSGDSIAGQLGLKVRRIVIDAGHGGKDTGAIGPHGVREKDMALSIARKVAARLRQEGFTVVMTRKDDTFIALDDRTRIANEAHADLFVSIHCNAARRRKLEGVETWTLNVASDRYATRLAAFENAEADHTVSELRMILADLATKANASDARDLAQSVQSSLVRTLRSHVGPVHDHGVKQALFYVLLGTHMPSILVETGFISNPAEEARLKSAKFQDGTAEAIARGVKDFVDSRRRFASIN